MTEYASTSEAPSDHATIAGLHPIIDAFGFTEVALIATAHRLVRGGRR